MTDKTKPEGLSYYGPGNKLWMEVWQTDPAFAKKFTKGGFSGTAVDALYNVQRISNILGPVGFAWGWHIKSESFQEACVALDDVNTVIHQCIVSFWFKHPDGSIATVEQYGSTPFAYRTGKTGAGGYVKVDEDPGKKSLTDAISKMLSCLGASADIFTGQFDDNKWVQPNDEVHQPPVQLTPEPTIQAMIDQITQARNIAELTAMKARIGDALTGYAGDHPLVVSAKSKLKARAIVLPSPKET